MWSNCALEKWLLFTFSLNSWIPRYYSATGFWSCWEIRPLILVEIWWLELPGRSLFLLRWDFPSIVPAVLESRSGSLSGFRFLHLHISAVHGEWLAGLAWKLVWVIDSTWVSRYSEAFLLSWHSVNFLSNLLNLAILFTRLGSGVVGRLSH